MSLRKLTKGFTLVEMLVVIAIIAILASALFPAIKNAMDQASATALKNKGRGIWIAITSENNEQIKNNRSALWPRECVEKKRCDDKDSLGYFTYLLSNGKDKGTIETDKDNRVVGDLTPESLIGSGISVGTTSIGKDNTAWVVCDVGDNSPSEMPFLFTRNVNVSDIAKFDSSNEDDDGDKIDLSDIKPFGTKRAVWVTVGGGTSDARAKMLTNKLVLGGISTNCLVWVMK